MKRLIPLVLTTVCGFILIVSYFIPVVQWLGEFAAISFDILAAIAMILGGGNLLKIHLKKISDRPAGWGYSVVTLLAFFITLYVGLAKWGVRPARQQEKYGETYASLPLDEFPLTYSVEGKIPTRADKEKLPASARWQIRQEDEKIVFRGWMSSHQKAQLIDYKHDLEWQCAVEKLFEKAKPPKKLKGKVKYLVDHEVLSFKGHMTGEDRAELLKLGDNEAWTRAVDVLHKKTQKVSKVEVAIVPRGFDALRAEKISPSIGYDEGEKVLSIRGPMSSDQRDALARQFPVEKPLSPQRREALLKELADRGPLSEKQKAAFHKVLDATWTVEQLRKVLDEAGKAEETDRTCCEMLEDRQAGLTTIELKKTVGKDQKLSDRQVELIEQFVENDDWTVEELTARLDETYLSGKQEAALETFFQKIRTEGRRKYDLFLAMMKAGTDPQTGAEPTPLTEQQRDYLVEDYKDEIAWRAKVYELFVAAHAVKYPWSGKYNDDGTPFWWLYEYAFKPLTATMFAMLAFYVASAAFRAFRAKNLEAILLLSTAFVILLGRTAAGVVTTAWLPGWLSELRIENLTVTIMSIFNTAGNRAIMIGIALGIASTSLKVLLGIDRSYLGSGEE